MHCKWRCIAFAPFRVYRTSLFQNRAPRTGHTAAHPLPSPLPSSCFTATKILQKNRLYKKYRRLRSLTAHHSTVNQFQPHSLLRSVARNLAATLVINYPPRHNQYTIIQENCQCRKIKILQDILYRLRGLCRRHETKGNKNRLYKSADGCEASQPITLR